jgi:tRNA pseudouridine38-40 synthase
VRLRLDLAYDGTGFHGWAAQPGLRTVQAEVETALTTVLRRPAPLTCAGRTDAGVHARGQVVHLDVEPAVLDQAAGRSAGHPTEALLRRLNGVLAPDVRVLRAAEAADGFDARFSALWRRYVYRICDVPSAADPRTRTFVVAWPRLLDEGAMNEAARALLGEHDFAAFCKQREGASTVRELLELRVARTREGLDTTVRADAFCHSMVRALVGCLVAVGEGRRPASWAGEVLGSRVRDPAVTVMPAHGLTLDEVCYPGETELAARATATRRLRVPEGP